MMADDLDMGPIFNFMMENPKYQLRLDVIVNGCQIRMIRMDALQFKAWRCFYWETLANAGVEIVRHGLDEMKVEIDRRIR